MYAVAEKRCRSSNVRFRVLIKRARIARPAGRKSAICKGSGGISPEKVLK